MEEYIQNAPRASTIRKDLTGKVVTTASIAGGKFNLKIEKHTIDYVESVEVDYLFIASGSSQQGYSLATQLGHSFIDPVPSLFTFKIDDSMLTELSGAVIVPQRLLKKRLLSLNHENNAPPRTSSCYYEWLVKWRGLDYKSVTWELDSFLSSICSWC